jgi:hypothetical protein
MADKRSWAFEFKQWNPETAARPSGRLESSMKRAEFCASKILRADANAAVAGLIPLHWMSDASLVRARANAEAFAAVCDYCWKITGHPDARETYLFFNVVRRFP